MLTIYKYEVPSIGNVMLPRNAEFLSVQAQGETLQSWWLVDTSEQTEPVTLYVYGTGHKVSRNRMDYLGTCQLHGGSLVLHVFRSPR